MLFSTLAAAALLWSNAALAAPIYFTASGVLPGDLGALQIARNVFQASAGSGLSTEGFEAGVTGNPIDFGDFTATLSSGAFGSTSGIP